MLTLKFAIAFFRGNFYIAYIRLLMNRELILNGHQDFLIQYFLDFLRFFNISKLTIKWGWAALFIAPDSTSSTSAHTCTRDLKLFEISLSYSPPAPFQSPWKSIKAIYILYIYAHLTFTVSTEISLSKFTFAVYNIPLCCIYFLNLRNLLWW